MGSTSRWPWATLPRSAPFALDSVTRRAIHLTIGTDRDRPTDPLVGLERGQQVRVVVHAGVAADTGLDVAHEQRPLRITGPTVHHRKGRHAYRTVVGVADGDRGALGRRRRRHRRR